MMKVLKYTKAARALLVCSLALIAIAGFALKAFAAGVPPKQPIPAPVNPSKHVLIFPNKASVVAPGQCDFTGPIENLLVDSPTGPVSAQCNRSNPCAEGLICDIYCQCVKEEAWLETYEKGYCVTKGYSSDEAKKAVDSVLQAVNGKWDMAVGAGELEYSTVECFVPFAEAQNSYAVVYNGPRLDDWTASKQLPDTIEVIKTPLLIAPLSSVSGTKASVDLDLSGTSFAADLSGAMPQAYTDVVPNVVVADIGDSGQIINNVFSHKVVSSVEKAPGNLNLWDIVAARITPYCNSWTARGGGGDACPGPQKVKLEEVAAASKADMININSGVWDPRFRYIARIVRTTKSGPAEGDAAILGVHKVMLGAGGGGCNCDIASTYPSFGQMAAAAVLIGSLGIGLLRMRKKANRRRGR